MGFIKIFVPALLASLVVACGGGGGATAPTTTPSSILSGTAAAGAPIIGSVTIKGALGNTKSALIEANGNYNVDVAGLTAPYRLRAEGTVGGRLYKLHSYAVAGDVGNTVNITPFTDLIVANVAGQIAESYFDTNNVPELTVAELDAQETELQAKLQDVFTALGIDTAIDLLSSTFSTNHTGLDAALDILRVEVDADTNIATITNLVENTTIEDNLTTTGETETLVVNDAAALTTTISDTQAIALIFDAFEAAFVGGLPTQASIQDYFADDFLDEDKGKGQFLTFLTTTPGFINLTLSGITVTNLDSTAGTAEVKFSFGVNGIVEVNHVKWFAAKDATLGWQMRGDQRIVETGFSYHCNHYDAADTNFPGACGLNTQFWDNDFTNNGTGGVAIASGTVKIIDQITSAVKATIYLGTPTGGTAGDVQVYAGSNNYRGDYVEFGLGAFEVDPSIFVPGDTIEYVAYTADLDLTDLAAPVVTGTPVVTYTDTVVFEPENVLTKMPTATDATIAAISNFTLDNNLTVAWNLKADTRIEEILVRITDSQGNNIEIWDWMLGSTATSKTFSSSSLSASAAATAGLLSTDTTYRLKVRIYAADVQTGQSHSRDYNATIPGPAAGTNNQQILSCTTRSGWDQTADNGLGAPINPHSFADFEAVVTDCGSATMFDASAVSGQTFNFADGGVVTFNADGSGTYSDPDVYNLTWTIEQASGHSYIVINATSATNSNNVYRDTFAIISLTDVPPTSGTVFTFISYYEQPNFGDFVRASGSDGEIYGGTFTQQ